MRALAQTTTTPILDTHIVNDIVGMDLTHGDRLKFKTITISEVHARDTVDSFVQQHIMDARNFQWMSQLRLHWLKELDNLYVEHYSGICVIVRTYQ